MVSQEDIGRAAGVLAAELPDVRRENTAVLLTGFLESRKKKNDSERTDLSPGGTSSGTFFLGGRRFCSSVSKRTENRRNRRSAAGIRFSGGILR